jgi:DNA-binding NarL/FixJ family response regulator
MPFRLCHDGGKPGFEHRAEPVHSVVRQTTGKNPGFCRFRSVSPDVKDIAVSIGISIVEDDGVVSELLAQWISETESLHLVSTFSNAEAAMKRLPKENPRVVLMDINLPGKSGIHCVGNLKLQMPGTQFLMLTVYEDTDHIFEALAAGANGYLLKRTTREELVAAIFQICDGGSPMTSYVARKVVQAFQETPPNQSSGAVLSVREAEVLRLLARGLLYKEIASALNISVSSVNTYVTRIYEKLHVHSRSEAIARSGTLPPPGPPRPLPSKP